MANEFSIIAKELGKRGGTKTKEKYGAEHYKKISKMGVDKRKELRKQAGIDKDKAVGI